MTELESIEYGDRGTLRVESDPLPPFDGSSFGSSPVLLNRPKRSVFAATVASLSLATPMGLTAGKTSTANEAMELAPEAQCTEVPAVVSDLLEHAQRRQVALPLALNAATVLLAELNALGVVPKVATTRSGSIVVTQHVERRFAVFECDGDGDVVLTLSDRASDNEADAFVVTNSSVVETWRQILKFLG